MREWVTSHLYFHITDTKHGEMNKFTADDKLTQIACASGFINEMCAFFQQ